MNNFWLRLKVFFKLALFGALAIYVCSFVIQNQGRQTRLWFWFGDDWTTSVLLATVGSFAAGIVTALLFGTIWKTYRQFREIRSRNRVTRMEREMDDMRAKAQRLQTRK